MTEYEVAREKMAVEIAYADTMADVSLTREENWAAHSEDARELFRQDADYILSLVEIASDDQGLPDLPKAYCSELMFSEKIAYLEAQQDMITGDETGYWKKVVRK